MAPGVSTIQRRSLERVYNPRMRKLRMTLGLIILVLSLILLAWGLWPAAREHRSLRVSPSEMTLPTPSSFLPGVEIGPQASASGWWAGT